MSEKQPIPHASCSSTKKPGDICCVVGCKNNSLNSPGTVFYTFSTLEYKKDQREKWIRAVKRVNSDGSKWQPNKRSRICSRHFIGNKKSDHPANPSFVPTIFPELYKKSAPPSNAIERFNRAQKRRILATDTAHDNQCFQKGDSRFELQEEILLSADNLNTKSFEEKEVQLDFFCFDEVDEHKTFICNRFVYNGINDVETQTYIPVSKVKKDLVFTKTKDKCCGTNNAYKDKAVGPDTTKQSFLSKCPDGFHGYQSIRTEQELLDIAGVSRHNFQLLAGILKPLERCKIESDDRLLIFLMKMKLGVTFSALAAFFHVHRSTVSRIFFSVLTYLSQACKNFVFWPSRTSIINTMPDVFKSSYSNCRVIIDCTEFKVEQPPSIEQRVYLYSNYKKGFTVKVLVGCSPNGQISFVSKCFGGRTTDAQITVKSGILDLLEPDDVVLADKGFPEIKTILDDRNKGVLLVMPPFLYKNDFTAEEVAETYRIASIRIHIERIMQRIRIYGILSKIPIKLLPWMDDIVFVCCVLVNLQPPILKNDQNNETPNSTG